MPSISCSRLQACGPARPSTGSASSPPCLGAGALGATYTLAAGGPAVGPPAPPPGFCNQENPLLEAHNPSMVSYWGPAGALGQHLYDIGFPGVCWADV